MRKVPLNESLYASIGKLVLLRRKQLGLTQVELAEKISVTRASIANIETGRQRPTLDTFYSIAEALDCEPWDLVPNKKDVEMPVLGKIPKKHYKKKAPTLSLFDLLNSKNKEAVEKFIKFLYVEQL